MAGICNLCIEFIKEAEGFHATPYKTLAGGSAIGYGYIIKESGNNKKITKTEANVLLQKEIANLYKLVSKIFPGKLNHTQTIAVASYMQSIGKDNFKNSSLYYKIQSGDFSNIAQHFFDMDPLTEVSKNNKLYKILKRRMEEVNLFMKEPTAPPINAEAAERANVPEAVSVPDGKAGEDKIEATIDEVAVKVNKLQTYLNKTLDILRVISNNKSTILGILGFVNIKVIVDFFKEKFDNYTHLLNFTIIPLIIIIIFLYYRK